MYALQTRFIFIVYTTSVSEVLTVAIYYSVVSLTNLNMMYIIHASTRTLWLLNHAHPDLLLV